ncbi:HNH endonuclease [Auraticoccus sp. F435]|uniref:HNH endonuclease n=2 Tax=Auraticoccus cholistanensis TaxID=2656650 RepID=A0A6A9UW23_9ACTN|nr:HNH endonuclease [Auraticoccus cholistanensis]
MQFLDQFRGNQLVTESDVAGFVWQGTPMRLMDRQRGIRKPRQLSAALTFRTVFTPPDGVPPYADQEGPDGFQRYKMRGDDPEHAENRALRQAMLHGLPLIWFVGVERGTYLPIYPVYLVAEERELRQFVVALAPEQRYLLGVSDAGNADDVRRYADRITRQRLHQPMFRARVLAAYQQRCAMCRLRHVSLLDASHILPDGHELGQPVVPNGLALCKIHHAAFDQNIIGIRPDLQIVVREQVLLEVDGPMLRHGIQELDGRRLEVPGSPAADPSADRLEVRYNDFLAAI